MSVRLSPADAEGLTTIEAARRLQEFGPNTVGQPRRSSVLSSVGVQLRDPLILVLLAAAVLTSTTGDFTDGENAQPQIAHDDRDRDPVHEERVLPVRNDVGPGARQVRGEPPRQQPRNELAPVQQDGVSRDAAGASLGDRHRRLLGVQKTCSR